MESDAALSDVRYKLQGNQGDIKQSGHDVDQRHPAMPGIAYAEVVGGRRAAGHVHDAQDAESQQDEDRQAEDDASHDACVP